MPLRSGIVVNNSIGSHLIFGGRWQFEATLLSHGDIGIGIIKRRKENESENKMLSMLYRPFFGESTNSVMNPTFHDCCVIGDVIGVRIDFVQNTAANEREYISPFYSSQGIESVNSHHQFLDPIVPKHFGSIEFFRNGISLGPAFENIDVEPFVEFYSTCIHMEQGCSVFVNYGDIPFRYPLPDCIPILLPPPAPSLRCVDVLFTYFTTLLANVINNDSLASPEKNQQSIDSKMSPTADETAHPPQLQKSNEESSESKPETFHSTQDFPLQSSSDATSSADDLSAILTEVLSHPLPLPLRHLLSHLVHFFSSSSLFITSHFLVPWLSNLVSSSVNDTVASFIQNLSPFNVNGSLKNAFSNPIMTVSKNSDVWTCFSSADAPYWIASFNESNPSNSLSFTFSQLLRTSLNQKELNDASSLLFHTIPESVPLYPKPSSISSSSSSSAAAALSYFERAGVVMHDWDDEYQDTVYIRRNHEMHHKVMSSSENGISSKSSSKCRKRTISDSSENNEDTADEERSDEKHHIHKSKHIAHHSEGNKLNAVEKLDISQLKRRIGSVLAIKRVKEMKEERRLKRGKRPPFERLWIVRDEVERVWKKAMGRNTTNNRQKNRNRHKFTSAFASAQPQIDFLYKQLFSSIPSGSASSSSSSSSSEIESTANNSSCSLESHHLSSNQKSLSFISQAETLSKQTFISLSDSLDKETICSYLPLVLRMVYFYPICHYFSLSPMQMLRKAQRRRQKELAKQKKLERKEAKRRQKKEKATKKLIGNLNKKTTKKTALVSKVLQSKSKHNVEKKGKEHKTTHQLPASSSSSSSSSSSTTRATSSHPAQCPLSSASNSFSSWWNSGQSPNPHRSFLLQSFLRSMSFLSMNLVSSLANHHLFPFTVHSASGYSCYPFDTREKQCERKHSIVECKAKTTENSLDDMKRINKELSNNCIENNSSQSISSSSTTSSSSSAHFTRNCTILSSPLHTKAFISLLHRSGIPLLDLTPSRLSFLYVPVKKLLSKQNPHLTKLVTELEQPYIGKSYSFPLSRNMFSMLETKMAFMQKYPLFSVFDRGSGVKENEGRIASLKELKQRSQKKNKKDKRKSEFDASFDEEICELDIWGNEIVLDSNDCLLKRRSNSNRKGKKHNNQTKEFLISHLFPSLHTALSYQIHVNESQIYNIRMPPIFMYFPTISIYSNIFIPLSTLLPYFAPFALSLLVFDEQTHSQSDLELLFWRMPLGSEGNVADAETEKSKTSQKMDQSADESTANQPNSTLTKKSSFSSLTQFSSISSSQSSSSLRLQLPPSISYLLGFNPTTGHLSPEWGLNQPNGSSHLFPSLPYLTDINGAVPEAENSSNRTSKGPVSIDDVRKRLILNNKERMKGSGRIGEFVELNRKDTSNEQIEEDKLLLMLAGLDHNAFGTKANVAYSDLLTTNVPKDVREGAIFEFQNQSIKKLAERADEAVNELLAEDRNLREMEQNGLNLPLSGAAKDVESLSEWNRSGGGIRRRRGLFKSILWWKRRKEMGLLTEGKSSQMKCKEGEKGRMDGNESKNENEELDGKEEKMGENEIDDIDDDFLINSWRSYSLQYNSYHNVFNCWDKQFKTDQNEIINASEFENRKSLFSSYFSVLSSFGIGSGSVQSDGASQIEASNVQFLPNETKIGGKDKESEEIEREDKKNHLENSFWRYTPKEIERAIFWALSESRDVERSINANLLQLLFQPHPVDLNALQRVKGKQNEHQNEKTGVSNSNESADIISSQSQIRHLKMSKIQVTSIEFINMHLQSTLFRLSAFATISSPISISLSLFSLFQTSLRKITDFLKGSEKDIDQKINKQEFQGLETECKALSASNRKKLLKQLDSQLVSFIPSSVRKFSIYPSANTLSFTEILCSLNSNELENKLGISSPVIADLASFRVAAQFLEYLLFFFSKELANHIQKLHMLSSTLTLAESRAAEAVAAWTLCLSDYSSHLSTSKTPLPPLESKESNSQEITAKFQFLSVKAHEAVCVCRQLHRTQLNECSLFNGCLTMDGFCLLMKFITSLMIGTWLNEEDAIKDSQGFIGKTKLTPAYQHYPFYLLEVIQMLLRMLCTQQNWRLLTHWISAKRCNGISSELSSVLCFSPLNVDFIPTFSKLEGKEDRFLSSTLISPELAHRISIAFSFVCMVVEACVYLLFSEDCVACRLETRNICCSMLMLILSFSAESRFVFVEALTRSHTIKNILLDSKLQRQLREQLNLENVSSDNASDDFTTMDPTSSNAKVETISFDWNIKGKFEQCKNWNIAQATVIFVMMLFTYRQKTQPLALLSVIASTSMEASHKSLVKSPFQADSFEMLNLKAILEHSAIFMPLLLSTPASNDDEVLVIDDELWKAFLFCLQNLDYASMIDRATDKDERTDCPSLEKDKQSNEDGRNKTNGHALVEFVIPIDNLPIGIGGKTYVEKLDSYVCDTYLNKMLELFKSASNSNQLQQAVEPPANIASSSDSNHGEEATKSLPHLRHITAQQQFISSLLQQSNSCLTEVINMERKVNESAKQIDNLEWNFIERRIKSVFDQLSVLLRLLEGIICKAPHFLFTHDRTIKPDKAIGLKSDLQNNTSSGFRSSNLKLSLESEMLASELIDFLSSVIRFASSRQGMTRVTREAVWSAISLPFIPSIVAPAVQILVHVGIIFSFFFVNDSRLLSDSSLNVAQMKGIGRWCHEQIAIRYATKSYLKEDNSNSAQTIFCTKNIHRKEIAHSFHVLSCFENIADWIEAKRDKFSNHTSSFQASSSTQSIDSEDSGKKDDLSECQICFARACDTIIEPCKHEICAHCFIRISESTNVCPFCSVKITGSKKKIDAKN
ncbi:uncharacterized protein MONOS_8554 [Monocercomonoides exilis]|uniref:uncharacterized protein n=1 Tax=Monocercomonoides exilis TaxID=2049356 RepID=UPI00355A1E9B|nr:hypothetical protein MONOS_8554 [Monocercomonoides exilis]|eukprot:MONOS_8554.1-p1 / transcript=MONOS_8554.1 / gene=MONOS_8554 / organism=Monocercomonoides_exilis_PA203 / gene_product=unspecified product / transcript_product=unspecified product / location=Mono_scaffold00325:28182-36797(-) / protein_length=2820 / sequence_SO=supercontig / SO=protein_coding / is_pseudo=false